MRRLFKFHYPKITLLIITTLAAIYLFSNSAVLEKITNLNDLSYFAMFIAGLLFSFGFSTPFAVGFFVTANPSNIWLAAIIGGVGALISDMLIFSIIKISFMDEFNRLEKTHPIKILNKTIHNTTSKKLRNYLTYIFAGLIIASPLPDELGVSMLAGLTHIKRVSFTIISLVMNTAGILIMLGLGTLF